MGIMKVNWEIEEIVKINRSTTKIGFYGSLKTVIKPYMTGVSEGHKDWTVQPFSDESFNSNLD